MSRRKSAEGRLSPTLRKGLAHIRSCEKSGETLKSYAERRGLSVRSLYDAKKKLRVHGIVAPHGKPPAAAALPRNLRRLIRSRCIGPQASEVKSPSIIAIGPSPTAADYHTISPKIFKSPARPE